MVDMMSSDKSPGTEGTLILEIHTPLTTSLDTPKRTREKKEDVNGITGHLYL